MPIVYVHGVATRNSAADPTVVRLMQGYLSDVLTPGRDVDVMYAYWGDAAATFAWDGASRPRSALLGQGVGDDVQVSQRAVLAAALGDSLAGGPVVPRAGAVVERGPLVPAGAGSAGNTAAVRLKDMPPDALSDFLLTVLVVDAQAGAELIMAADEVAHDQSTRAALALARDVEQEWALLAGAIEARSGEPALVGQGAGGMRRLSDRVQEYLDRGAGVPGYVASRLVAELRGPANRLATTFVGDVFHYLSRRGNPEAVGEIPQRFLTKLREATQHAMPGEPVVVISHSMGGQIVYDAVTTLLPQIGEYRDLRIDYWCATASQVGLFEELKLFWASRPGYGPAAPVPFPDRAHLGGWWNAWDHNDFLSYTVHGIVAEVDDEPFDSGMGLAAAHSGYLFRPSFYRRLANKLAAAKEMGWGR